ncbi:MAG: DNA polymerase III subunit gamma/tau [Deltaproteobacteria bacterium]|nr:DNA polymerase III subunit gamma/tau [Deltaproteobacteria bacterium]
MRLFPEEGTAGGCASGECLPGEPAAPPPGPASASPGSPSSPVPVVRITNAVRPPAPPLPSFEPVALGQEGEADEPEEPPAAFQRSGRDDPTRSTVERWHAAVDSVRGASARHAASLAHARVLWIRPGDVTVGFTSRAEFHRVQLSGTGKTLVEEALSRHFGRPTKLGIEARPEAAEGAPPSLAEQEATERAARDRGADQKVRSHPAVASILKLLGGEIEHVQPLEPERAGPPPPSEGDEPLP